MRFLCGLIHNMSVPGYCIYTGINYKKFPISSIFTPKTPSKEAWIGIVKPNDQNIKACILSKLLYRFQPNLAKWQRQPNTLRGWSQEKSKNGRILATAAPICTKFVTVTHISPPKGTGIYNFELVKIQDGGRPPSRKVKNGHILATVWPISAKFGILMHTGRLIERRRREGAPLVFLYFEFWTFFNFCLGFLATLPVCLSFELHPFDWRPANLTTSLGVQKCCYTAARCMEYICDIHTAEHTHCQCV